jgi:hypothetical protein
MWATFLRVTIFCVVALAAARQIILSKLPEARPWENEQ